MSGAVFLIVLFLAKVLDNALGTSKTIFVQQSKWLLAGISVMLSDFIYFSLTKSIINTDSSLAIVIVSLAGGTGCSLACILNEKLSRDRTYVNVIMSDNLEAMMTLRDFLAKNHITNVASDTYTLDWNRKTISITAYPDTKAKNKLIADFIANSKTKYRRVLR